MAGHDLQFGTRWRVPGNISEIFALLADAEGWARWWPGVHPFARVVERGELDGTARIVELQSRGFAPGLLRWRLRTDEQVSPTRLAFSVPGRLEGRVALALGTEGPYTLVDSTCRLRVRGVAAATVSRVLAPLLAERHRGAMRLGELSLRLELRRLHAVTAHERAMVPPPPGAPRTRLAPAAQGSLAASWSGEPPGA